MSLPARTKQRFFAQLGQLLRSGVGLPQAAEKLGRAGTGAVRETAKTLQLRLEGGATAGEAFAALATLGPMERSCLASAARTGRLEVTLQRLADYFAVLDRARSEVIRKCLYPLFVLHFAVLASSVPTLMASGFGAFLSEIVMALAWLYAAGVAFLIVRPMVAEAGARRPAVDRLLRAVPLLGRIRRNLSVARFFGTCEMQLDSGVNVIDSVQAAAEASRSGLLYHSVEKALPGLRQGQPLGALLQTGGGLPADAVSAVMLAEESGQLHRTLPQLQEEYERDGMHLLQIAAEWMPRLLYLAVAFYAAWKIIAGYVAVEADAMRQLDAL